jgi:hypothetical protein
MAFRRLTDREAARVGVAVSAGLQVAAAMGWAGLSNVSAGEATQVLVVTVPLTLAAGEWIRRKVFSRHSVNQVRSVVGDGP